MRRLLFFLLKREYKRHKNVMHDYDDCVFCYMNSVEAQKFMKEGI